MAAVRFIFGSGPVIDELDAIELVGLLERLGVTPAFSIASKIRFEALRGSARGGRARPLSLDLAELGTLLALLEGPLPRLSESLTALREELRASVALADPLEPPTEPARAVRRPARAPRPQEHSSTA